MNAVPSHRKHRKNEKRIKKEVYIHIVWLGLYERQRKRRI
jgi:hypothetical protein